MTSNHHWHIKNVFSNNPLSILIIKTPDRERVKRSSYQENQISIRIDQVVQSTRVGWKWVSERRREKTYNCLFCIYWNQELRERERCLTDIVNWRKKGFLWKSEEQEIGKIKGCLSASQYILDLCPQQWDPLKQTLSIFANSRKTITKIFKIGNYFEWNYNMIEIERRFSWSQPLKTDQLWVAHKILS